MTRKCNRSIRLLGWITILLMISAASETMSFLVGEYFVTPRAAFIFYRQPNTKVILEDDVTNYLKTRDPVLGWPSPGSFGGDRYDPSGSRWIPSFPKPGTEYVSLYGDSYTYGLDVIAEEAWSNVLSKKIQKRVANFGVGGYGTDQAYIRFMKNTEDNAAIIILCIFPDNLKRNVNQQRYFLSPNPDSLFGLKPRFVLTPDSLSLVPLPKLTYSEFIDSYSHASHYFKHEFFIPGTSYGPTYWSFPYLLSLFKATLSPQVQSWMKGKPGWNDFFKEDHPSKALHITIAIGKEFVALAKKRGKKAFVVIFPSQSSFISYRRTGRLASMPLADNLNAAAIDTLNLTVGFNAYLGQRSYSELRVSKVSGHPHFNAEGNRLVADLVRNFMTEKGYYSFGDPRKK